MQAIYAITAILLMLALPMAHAETYDLSNALEVVYVDTTKTWIFIADRQCTSQDMVDLRAEIETSKKGYDLSEGRQYDYAAQTTNPYEVVCFPHAEIATIEITTDLMRAIYPNDIFVYVFDLSPEKVPIGMRLQNFTYSTPEGMATELTEITTYRNQYPDTDWFWWRIQLLALDPSIDVDMIEHYKGVALIELGIAFADNEGSTINHEWSHVRACALHGQGADDRDASTWTPYPWDDGPASWCMG